MGKNIPSRMGNNSFNSFFNSKYNNTQNLFDLKQIEENMTLIGNF